MKRMYLIMVMIAAMMMSCNPKDDDDNGSHGGNGSNGGGGITGIYNPEKKISKIVWQDDVHSSFGGTEDWRWSGDRLQNIIDEDGCQYNFYYNSNGMIESYADDEGEKWIFEYKGNLLSEIHCYDDEDYCYRICKLQYSNGKVSKVEQVWYPYDEDKESSTYIISWNGANVSRVSMYESDTYYCTITYEYDNKKNPFYSYMGGYPIMSGFMQSNVMVLSANNITKVNVEVGSGYDGNSCTIANVYKYDNDGYPTKVQMTIADSWSESYFSFNIEYLNNGNNGGNGNDDDNDNGEIAGHGYVDLGLPSGLKWATCNVGANKPEEYGNYYAWGETTTKSDYSSSNSLTSGLSKSELQSQGYIDGSGNLTSQHDAATANWGGSWRMPTKDEMQELVNHCEWEWTQVNGVYGSKVTGPNGSCIFLPAAGFRYGSSLLNAGNDGYFWSSTPGDGSGDYGAYYLHFDFGYEDVYGYDRNDGQTVRPISE